MYLLLSPIFFCQTAEHFKNISIGDDHLVFFSNAQQSNFSQEKNEICVAYVNKCSRLFENRFTNKHYTVKKLRPCVCVFENFIKNNTTARTSAHANSMTHKFINKPP